jgi:hypothetical protein
MLKLYELYGFQNFPFSSFVTGVECPDGVTGDYVL